MLLYRNGILEGSAHLTSSVSQFISPGGSFYLGKSHTFPGAIQGSFADLNMWPDFIQTEYNLTASAVYGFKCTVVSKFAGSAISWANVLKADYNGNVVKRCPATCI